MSLALSLSLRLYEGTQELARAWDHYAEKAMVVDGHTTECAYRQPWTIGATGECTCGYAKVERAIRELTTIVNTRDSAQGA